MQSLDIGYEYTHDGGKTFPFRGKGVGKMPSLTEVLEKFPNEKFLINIKSNKPSETDLIKNMLKLTTVSNISIKKKPLLKNSG